MKAFEDICRMTQPEVKAYMKSYLSSKSYKVIDEDGFLYAKGTVPVLIVAHMDTVHNQQCNTIVNNNGKISSPQGIGGDDRCGVFIIMNLVKELNCSVLLCEDEEKGGIGAHKFVEAKYEEADENGNKVTKKYIENLGVNYMIEFDRRGSHDAVFYSCDNTDFIDLVEDVTCFKFAYGSFSDISVLMPAAKLSGVNLSCGYYGAHHPTEYVVYDEMMDTIEAAKVLIKEPCEKPFEYIEKKYKYAQPNRNYSYGNHNYGNYNSNYYKGTYRTPQYYSDMGDGSYYGSLYDTPPYNEPNNDYKDERLANIAKTDTDLELEVIVYDENLSEKTIDATGETKAECWMNLFLENPTLCFNDIVDYSWG